MALLHRLRFVVLAEAVSWLLLAGAMVLKHGPWDMPRPVSVTGMIHGVLFLWLLWLLVRTRMETDWPARRLWLLGLASLLPVVPFFLDRELRRWIAETPAPPPQPR